MWVPLMLQQPQEQRYPFLKVCAGIFIEWTDCEPPNYAMEFESHVWRISQKIVIFPSPDYFMQQTYSSVESVRQLWFFVLILLHGKKSNLWAEKLQFCKSGFVFHGAIWRWKKSQFSYWFSRRVIPFSIEQFEGGNSRDLWFSTLKLLYENRTTLVEHLAESSPEVNIPACPRLSV